MSTPPEGISPRQLGALVALWFGWSLAFGLAQTMVDSLLRSQVPRPGILVLLFAVALTSVWIGKGLWPGWRGALGLISIVFAVFGGAIGLWRSRGGPPGAEAAAPGTSWVAVAVAVAGSIVAGVVLLQAERLRKK